MIFTHKKSLAKVSTMVRLLDFKSYLQISAFLLSKSYGTLSMYQKSSIPIIFIYKYNYKYFHSNCFNKDVPIITVS